jgi:hypothetical protein
VADKTPVDNSSQQPDNQSQTTDQRVDKQTVDDTSAEDLNSGRAPKTGGEESTGSETGNPSSVTGAE